MRIISKLTRGAFIAAILGMAEVAAPAMFEAQVPTTVGDLLDTYYERYFREFDHEEIRHRNAQSTTHMPRTSTEVDRLNIDSHYRDYFKYLSHLLSTTEKSTGQHRRTSRPGDSNSRSASASRSLTAIDVSATQRGNENELIQMLRHGFRLPELDTPLVRNYEKWYSRNPRYLKRVLMRGADFLPYIVSEVNSRGLPAEIALLPVIESAFNPFAKSHANAVGLWQFIDPTARRFGLRLDFWFDGRRDIVDSTEAALDYLEFLSKEMSGDWFHAFAAYNAGEHKLRKEIRRNLKAGKSTHFSTLSLYRETRHYVPKLVALRNVIRSPERFAVDLPKLTMDRRFVEITIDYPIDLAVAATLAEIPLNRLRRLNPGFKRRTTGEQGTTQLLLPIETKEVFSRALRSRSAKSLLASASYRVRRGDSLSRIARRNGLSIASIKQANKLSNDVIRAGQVLTLPIRSQHYSAIGVDGVSLFNTTDGNQKPSNKRERRITHSVKRGDTLSGIARRYRVYVNQIAAWNAIRTTDIIKRGQKLVIFR